MTAITRYISYFIIAALLACGVWGCDRGFDPDEPDLDGEEKYMLLLHVMPIAAGETADATATEVTERIKSLRIIVLTVPDEESDGTTASTPKIEYNKLEDIKEGKASAFEHPVSLWLTKGKKDIYLIANEESVDDIQYSPEMAGLPTMFSTFLERYDLLKNPEADAAEFKKAVEAIYFKPNYVIDGQKRIYLPYTSYYQLEVKEEEENNPTKNNPTMYLVPVATKFTFKFINKRDNDVTVSKISVKGTDTHNFLLAHVGEDEYEKDFVNEDGKTTSLYWIDWLAKVSEATHGAADNAAVNEKYGWISDYKIPAGSKNAETDFIAETDQVIVPTQKKDPAGDGSELDEPGVLVLGPYYRPESRREKTVTDEEGKETREHEYLLTLDLKDSKSGDGPEFINIPIENLHALFRNTSVYITVTMSSGDVEVYAEISDWNRHEANGWVSDSGDGKFEQSGSNAN